MNTSENEHEDLRLSSGTSNSNPSATPSKENVSLLASSASLVSTDHRSSFHTAPVLASSTDGTLIDSSEIRRRVALDEEEDTLADSVVDSMYSCADTIAGEDSDEEDEDEDEDEDLTLLGDGGTTTLRLDQVGTSRISGVATPDTILPAPNKAD